VTKKHIEAGEKGSCRRCPIALALIDRGFKAVSVGYNIVVASSVRGLTAVRSSKAFKAITPVKARDFMSNFDNGVEPIKPFRFTLTTTKQDLKRVGFKAA
jgi:hypothetical protein